MGGTYWALGPFSGEILGGAKLGRQYFSAIGIYSARGVIHKLFLHLGGEGWSPMWSVCYVVVVVVVVFSLGAGITRWINNW